MIRRAFMAAIGAAIAAPLAWLWPRKSCVDVGPEEVKTLGAPPCKMSTWWWKLKNYKTGETEWCFSHCHGSLQAPRGHPELFAAGQIAGYAEWDRTLTDNQLDMLKEGVTPSYFERSGLLLYVPGHRHV